MAQPTYNPDDYRKCPICFAKIGEFCTSLSGTIVNGRPDGIRVYTEKPHNKRVARRRKAAYTRAPLAR